MGIKAKASSIWSVTLALTVALPAVAHAPHANLPLHDAVSALPAVHRALTGLPFTNKLSALSSRIPGLSGASSAFVLRNRAIASGSFNNVVGSTVISQVAQGQVSSGLLSGTFYESFGGNNFYNIFPQYVFAFGNNPLSTNGGTTFPAAPSSVINSIAFSGPQTLTTRIVHGVVMHTAVPTSALSGSERASEAQINALSKGAGTAGFNYASSLFKSSPIVGGNFFGTDYYQATAGVFTYNKNATFDYAFGNAPLNITQTNTLPGNLTNYIQLANGKIFTYSDGLLPTSTYFLGGAFDHNWIFALGKNQYNFFSNFASAPSTISFTKLPAPYLHF